MRLRVLLEPRYGASYAQILAMARAAEEAGFDAFFRSDHYLGIDPSDASYAPTDSWATLAGLAVQTQRVRLGTLMTASTFRYPGPLAVTVGTVDAMSGGRVELGIGAAWYEREHQAFGIPFPPTGERFDRLEEQLSILAGLWSTPPGERFSYQGQHYQLAECANFPVLAQARGADAGPPELVDVTSGPLEGTRCHIDTRADTDGPRAHVGAPAFPAGLPRPRLIIGGAGPRRTGTGGGRRGHALFPYLRRRRHRSHPPPRPRCAAGGELTRRALWPDPGSRRVSLGGSVIVLLAGQCESPRKPFAVLLTGVRRRRSKARP